MKDLIIKEFFSIVERKKVQLSIIVSLFIVLGSIYTFSFVEPIYKTSTTLILTNAIIENNSFDFQESNQIIQSEGIVNSNLFSTYSELIKSNMIMEKVKTNLKLDIELDELRKNIEVSRITDTQLMKITVKNSNPGLACEIANEIIKEFSNNIQRFYNVNIYIVDEAIIDYVPYNVNHMRDIIVFFAIAIILSIIYVVLIYKFDTTIKSEETVEKEIGLKTLISIPLVKENKKNQTGLINFENKKTMLSEAYKTLRTNVQFTNVNNKGSKIMLITSSFSSEGKSYVAANLAISFAQAGKKVILIDTDMRVSGLSKIFNIPNNLGFSNYLSGLDTNGMETTERINSFINETAIKNLNIITSGNIPPNPTELLESKKLYELVKDLSVFYDMIIFDGAPILPSSDSLILTRIATSTILVALHNKTRKDELEKTKRDIQNVGGRVIGVVLNKVKIKDYNFISPKNNKEKNIVKNNNSKIKKIKKNILIIKEKITKVIKNIKKNEIKLLTTENEKQFADTTQNFDIQNYQISDEYIKENVDISKKADIENKKQILEDKDNSSINEAKAEEKEQQDEKKQIEKGKEIIKEKIENILKFLKSKFEVLKEINKHKNEERNKRKKEQIEEEKQREEELQKQELIEKEENKIIAETREKEKLEEEKRKLEIEKIKEAERIAKKEQEEIIAEKREKEKKEKEKIKYEEKLKKEALKLEKKDKKNQEKEERRKYKEEKKIKQKEEARIQEELSEDNLYPKTKYNKNL